MKTSLLRFITFGILLSLFPYIAQAATIPKTSKGHSFLHVNNLNSASPQGYTPVQIRHAYGFDKTSLTGAGKVIAIVDAFANPTIETDLAKFIATFRLANLNGLPGTSSCTVAAGPHPCFEKISAGTVTKTNVGWSTETALDTEWAHAIANGADILLIQTPSDSLSDLMGGVQEAVKRHVTVGSLSWGGPEFSKEASFDNLFSQGTQFVAASGDAGAGTSFPASSSKVLSVGGSTIYLDSSGNRSKAEVAWSGSGGGVSKYEARPDFQPLNLTTKSNAPKRLVPDVSYNANPQTGYVIYSSKTGWAEVGGTSAGTPQWAALLTLSSTGNALPQIYSLPISSFNDLKTGKNGTCTILCTSSRGYDLVTGLGTPIADQVINLLHH